MSNAQVLPSARRSTTRARLEEESPWDRLREANRLLRARTGSRLQGIGLSISEAVVLDLCSRAPAKASDVATASGLTAAGATDLIDRLEVRRLVRRESSATDRRVVLIALTPAGLRARGAVAAAKAETLRYLESTMRPEELAALAKGLDALTRALRPGAGRPGGGA